MDECDRIIEFWPFLCISEEQLREKRGDEEWKYQRKLGGIKFELMGLLDIEEEKGINLIENLENKKQNLSKMDRLIEGLSLSSMRNEANEIKERVIRAKHCKESWKIKIIPHYKAHHWSKRLCLIVRGILNRGYFLGRPFTKCPTKFQRSILNREGKYYRVYLISGFDCNEGFLK